MQVVVVVDLCCGLPGAGPQDPACVLDEPAFEGDGGGEEQGVQGRAVEPFADVGAGGDGEQGRAAWLGLEAGQWAARALAPIPPRSTTGSCPCWLSSPASRLR